MQTSNAQQLVKKTKSNLDPKNAAQAYSSYKIDPELSEAKVRVKYSLGTYLIPNRQVEGWMKVSKEKKLDSAQVIFQVMGFKSNDTTLDCHLRESLSLDYTQSDFPDSHVCVHDRLPSDGKNSAAYPTLSFETTGLNDLDLSKTNESELSLNVNGEWIIHGVKRKATVKILITQSSLGYRISGKHELSLKNFGVEVKNFLFISVQDQVEAEWNLQFIPGINI